jgi:hypothetical protein
MNRITLITSLVGALLILAAYALFAYFHPRWTPLQKHAAATSFYEPARIENKGGDVHLLLLLDYDAPQTHDKGAYRSVIEEIVINCGERSYYSQKRTTHQDRMGSGRVLFEDESALPYKPAPAFFAPILDKYCKS